MLDTWKMAEPGWHQTLGIFLNIQQSLPVVQEGEGHAYVEVRNEGFGELGWGCVTVHARGTCREMVLAGVEGAVYC